MALVVINKIAIAQMKRSGEWLAHLENAGKFVAAATAANAQMSSYRSSVTTDLRSEGDEMICRVGTDDPFAHLDEWGSINNAPTGAMRRAVQGTGMEAEFR